MLTKTLGLPALLLVGSWALFTPQFAFGQEGAHPGTAPREGRLPDGLSVEDWSAIRTAYQAARHAALPVDGGFEARNPEQAWRTRFDGRGFLVEPDDGGWTWGLALEGYGFAGREQRVARVPNSEAAGGRVTYRWSKALEEWFVNDTRGLEHGYTLLERPARGSQDLESPLTFTLGVHGNLRGRVVQDGRGVDFFDEWDALILTYAGLSVLDADGRELEASFEQLIGGLQLRIEERGARYPLLIDPIAQQAYLKASNPGPGDAFGQSVAVSGDTVVVGASAEDSGATGVNGSQGDGTADAGAAYVFVRSGTSWSQQAYLKASNTNAGDRLGGSVAISGDTVVIGAEFERSAAKGVNGNQADNGAQDAGAAYVFTRSGTSWSQQAYLKASNTEAFDSFGRSVAVSGDTLLVTAPGEDSNAAGVNGNQANNSGFESGAVYVFVRNGTSWTQEAYLKAYNSSPGYRFGWSAALSGDTLVVGSPFEKSDATGVNGSQSDNGAWSAGAAYVFVRNGTTWSQQAYLKASNTDAGDRFGESVALAGDTLVVGARDESSAATGVNGNEASNAALDAGAAYVFGRNGSSWSQEAYLKASNANAGDRFGFSVAASEDRVLVGAVWEDSNANGINGDQSDNSAIHSGAAYLFVRSGASWSQEAYLKASNPGWNDGFGGSVALSNDTLAVGASQESGSEGAAYAFLISSTGSAYCFGDGGGTACPCGNVGATGSGCANSSSSAGARLSATGDADVAADTLIFAVTGSVPGQPGMFFQGDGAVAAGNGVSFGDGLRCAGGNIVRLQVRTADAGGNTSSTVSISLRGGVSAGQTKRYQWWYRDPVLSPCLGGFNLSNGVEIAWN